MFCVVVVVEVIYVYLLIYDDLLCMDDDDLCYGKLIVYCVFDEVIVVLVGDVFYVFVFELFVDVVISGDFFMCIELVLMFGGVSGF